MRISDWSSDVCSSDLPQVDSLPSRASLLLRLGRSASFGAADGPHRSAAAAAAEVGVAAIGLEPRYTHARRHVDFLQDLSRLGVDPPQVALVAFPRARSEEHTSELQSLMRISYAVFCLQKKNMKTIT